MFEMPSLVRFIPDTGHSIRELARRLGQKWSFGVVDLRDFEICNNAGARYSRKNCYSSHMRPRNDRAPSMLRWQGRAMIGGAEWVYGYLGYPVSDGPDGVAQIDTIVGAVIRTVPHADGPAPAGYTATFYAVRASK